MIVRYTYPLTERSRYHTFNDLAISLDISIHRVKVYPISIVDAVQIYHHINHIRNKRLWELFINENSPNTETYVCVYMDYFSNNVDVIHRMNVECKHLTKLIDYSIRD